MLLLLSAAEIIDSVYSCIVRIERHAATQSPFTNTTTTAPGPCFTAPPPPPAAPIVVSPVTAAKAASASDSAVFCHRWSQICEIHQRLTHWCRSLRIALRVNSKHRLGNVHRHYIT